MATNLRNLVILGGFSDYFNRFVKRYANLQEYLDNCPLNETHTSKNFNPNDDVNATQILNYSHTWAPNYLLVIEPSNSTIESRWFVLETQRTRGDQYQLTLRRDVLADFYNDIIQAPSFIEKATLNQNDPFIFNSEKMDLNRIKKSETLLKDETGVGWLVGYVSRGNNYTINYPLNKNIKVDYSSLAAFNTAMGTDFTDSRSAQFWDKPIKNVLQINSSLLNINNGIETNKFYKCEIGFDQFWQLLNLGYNEIAAPAATNININGYLSAGGRLDSNEAIKYINDELNLKFFEDYQDVINSFETYISSIPRRYNRNKTEQLLSSNGKIININNKYYRIQIVHAYDSNYTEDIQKNSNLDIEIQYCISEAVASLASRFPDSQIAIDRQAKVKWNCQTNRYAIKFNEINYNGSLSTEIGLNRNQLEDAPYDMFCIPYGQINVVDGSDTLTTSKEWSLIAAQAIASQGATTWLYDLQLLPYCPIRSIANSIINIDSTMGVGITHEYIKYTDSDNVESNVAILFWASQCAGTFNIPFTRIIENNKIANETEMYRLVSPNYNGMFEFNAAKMNGISGFNVDFTYKPFNPYIHVNPNFAGLYGQDFDDARGLICGGDFSVAIVNDRWAEYEINNKNYQNIFDRQIQNLEFTQRQERINSYVGALGGAVAGAGAGLMLGGPAGAVAGGALGVVGGVADLAMMYGRQEETKSYQIDLYNMQLGNIKALPYSLTKSSALTYNNKIFPFLEFYDCTDEEKEALIKKLQYNGMTVGRIGTIQEFLQIDYSFIQCQLIRLEIAVETHIINTIYDELRKGVYIK